MIGLGLLLQEMFKKTDTYELLPERTDWLFLIAGCDGSRQQYVA
jgi:hypothetical protein